MYLKDPIQKVFRIDVAVVAVNDESPCGRQIDAIFPEEKIRQINSSDALKFGAKRRALLYLQAFQFGHKQPIVCLTNRLLQFSAFPHSSRELLFDGNLQVRECRSARCSRDRLT